MRAAAIIAVSLGLGLLWIKTGRDPLYWLIALLVILRAFLAQCSTECWSAVCRWWTAMPAAIERSRRDCLGGDNAANV